MTGPGRPGSGQPATEADQGPLTASARPWSGWAGNPLALAGMAFLVVVTLAVLVGPLLRPVDPDHISVLQRFASPSWTHPLGTDWLGRDELSRLLVGGRSSMFGSLALSGLSGIVGTGVGSIAGYWGGAVDTVVMRVVDAVLGLPSLLVALAIVAVLGPGFRSVAIGILVTWWTGAARLARGQVLAIRERPYVDAARAAGSSRLRALWRHVLPEAAGPMIVLVTLELGNVLLAISTLSYLGLGTQPPSPEWGSMVASSEAYLAVAPQLVLYPGLAIGAVVLSVNLLGDAIRDAFDPVLRTQLMSGSLRLG